jgi:hypothetical protein
MKFRKLRHRSSISHDATQSQSTRSKLAGVPKDDSGPAVQIQIMLSEIADLTIAMRELLMTLDRYVYFGGLVAAAAITVGLINHSNSRASLALVLAPYAIGLSFIYIVQIFTEIERRAGYKKFLEDQVRRQLGSPVLLDSDVSAWSARNRKSTWGAQIINAAGLSAFIYISIEQTRRYDGMGPSLIHLHVWNYHYLNVVALAILVLVLAAASVENWRESDRAYQAASAAYSKYSNESHDSLRPN